MHNVLSWKIRALFAVNLSLDGKRYAFFIHIDLGIVARFMFPTLEGVVDFAYTSKSVRLSPPAKVKKTLVSSLSVAPARNSNPRGSGKGSKR